jgi:hypothetical protein
VTFIRKTRLGCLADTGTAETIAKLAGDEEEVRVDVTKMLRDNPGPGEHALFN